MSEKINTQNSPLHGVGLKQVLEELVGQYGFDILYAYLNIRCFKTNPSLESSEKFLKKTEWARQKVESFYLYEFKNLPRASAKEFELPPRDRTIPEGQVPGEPKELSLEDAQRLQEKRAKKAAEHGRGRGFNDNRSRGGYGNSRNSQERSGQRGGPYSGNSGRSGSGGQGTTSTSSTGAVDPWANARKKTD